MKLTLFLFFTLVVTTMSLEDDLVDQFASTLSLNREEVQTCMNRANITEEDIKHLEENKSQLLEDNFEAEFNNTILKFGCLLACAYQTKDMMTGANLNMDKIKEFMSDKYANETSNTRMFQDLDSCSDQVKNMTNECDVSLTFTMCVMEKTLQHIFQSLAEGLAKGLADLANAFSEMANLTESLANLANVSFHDFDNFTEGIANLDK